VLWDDDLIHDRLQRAKANHRRVALLLGDTKCC
jgi:hypothetical protein